MSDWNPKLYLKFKQQRTQPAIDLIARCGYKNPERILDIGSGPGNSSNELRNKWLNADITGIDSSEAMINEAGKNYPKIAFKLRDATGNLDDLGKFDMIFSNAAVQWMPGIEKLLPYWFSMLKVDGVMAMQIPNPTQMAIHIAVRSVAADSRWCKRFDGFYDGLYLHEPSFYYDILSHLEGDIDIWETHYYHIMPSHESIIDWYSSTGMKPYLSELEEKERFVFKDLVLHQLKSKYPITYNGLVLFPFRRIFFTTIKQ